MSRNGSIIKVGGELMSTYPVSGDGMAQMVRDFYDDKMRLYKSEGFARYSTEGMFNAIMGKELFANMFACNNMFTVVGGRPYDHEGMRVMYDLAKRRNMGAETVRDGEIGESYRAPVKQIRVPFKDITFPFDIGLSFYATSGKDDVADIQQYIDSMGVTFENGLDADLLRPLSVAQPTLDGEETTINGIERVIACSTEVGSTYDGVEITASHVSPWGGVASDMYPMRSSGKLNNFDGYVNNVAGALTYDDMKALYSHCQPYWSNMSDPTNKVFGCSIVANEKMGALMDVNNIWRESVFTSIDFNGVKTMEGREGGNILLSSYRNIPIIVDGNYNFDEETGRVGDGMGPIDLLDLDNLWMSYLTPVDFASTQDFATTRQLRDKMVMHMRCETRCCKFLGQGRITNKTE